MKFFPILIFLLFSLNSFAEQKKIFSSSVEYELDVYYSNIALFVNLTEKEIPDIGEKNEFQVYSDLISRALLPRFLILEASIYPMPILGTQIKEHARSLYDDFNITAESNFIDSITAGFEEPYALTMFLGNMVKFTKSENQNTHNRGFMGLLFSTGFQHIAYNTLIEDKWYELEFKIKGDRIIKDEKLSWSFRTGLKFHENPEITDLVYISLKRKHLGYNAPIISWLFNSGYELTLKFSQETFEPIEQSIFIDKKMPIKAWGVSLSIGLGVINTGSGKYSGNIKDNKNDTLFVIRPSIEF